MTPTERERARAAATTGYRPGCWGHGETDAPVVIDEHGRAACPMCSGWSA